MRPLMRDIRMVSPAPSFFAVVCLTACVVLASHVASATPILINGSLELASLAMPQNGELLAGSTALTGWNIAGSSLSQDVLDWLGPRGGGPLWNVSDGEMMVELDGRNSQNGQISQAFATTPGVA
jgi:hypothetical protein